MTITADLALDIPVGKEWPGQKWSLPMTRLDADGVTPLPLATLTIEAAVVWRAGSFELNVGNGGIEITNEPGGLFRVVISDAQRETLPAGSIALGLVITDASGFSESTMFTLNGVALIPAES